MCMKLPDIEGYTLGEVREILKEAGFSIASVSVTAPPREKAVIYDDLFRVVRAGSEGGKQVNLVVCSPSHR